MSTSKKRSEVRFLRAKNFHRLYYSPRSLWIQLFLWLRILAKRMTNSMNYFSGSNRKKGLNSVLYTSVYSLKINGNK